MSSKPSGTATGPLDKAVTQSYESRTVGLRRRLSRSLTLTCISILTGLAGLRSTRRSTTHDSSSRSPEGPGHLLSQRILLILDQLIKVGLVSGDVSLFFSLLHLCFVSFLFEVCWWDWGVGHLVTLMLCLIKFLGTTISTQL